MIRFGAWATTRYTRGRWGRAILGVVLTFGACTSVASGAGKVERPTYDVEPADCVTSECHADVKSYPILHGPVIVNTCDACHKLISAKAHTFEPARQKAELCTYCHEFNTGMLPVVHKPVLTGECLGCHNPHGGRSHSLVREATSAALCGRCHENVALGKKFLHHPVQTGECDTCHRPHASRYPKLLDAVGTDLCLSCHREFEAEMARMKFTHKALDEGCNRCHDAHGTAYPMEVKQPISELCLSCHEAMKDGMTAAYTHPAVPSERACLTCHTAHGGNLAHLMSDLPLRICMNCHDKKTTPKDVELMTAMVRINDPNRFKHTPIRNGQCGGCHSIHEADQPQLLPQTYSTEFHQRFSVDKYALCFGCHDERLVDQEPADGATNFRDGKLNLHFVHVVEDGELGRNCRVCHGTHTGKFEALIRDRVPFGSWQMSIRFEKTSTGGTCVTGCHPAFAYDRENPAAPRATALQMVSSARVPPANKEEPVLAKWSGRDISGAEVTVPAAERPTVLLFLRADQGQSQEVLKMVSAATPQIGLAQVVIVLNGPQAREDARAFAATKTVTWPVVADTEYVLSRRQGVAAWPATVVVQADGVVVAHVGGAPLSLTVELQAYLDLATKKIDREALRTRLAAVKDDSGKQANSYSPLLGDGPGPRAAWLLQMGRKLREQGQTQEALALLADGLKLQPDSVPLQVERIRALADLKQATLALDLLKRLPPGAMPAWEPELLRGRMLAALGQWDEARRLVTAVLAGAGSDSSLCGAAHYLMGTIYEHDRNWEKAAQEYRAAHTTTGPPAGQQGQ
jgi:predicted CXXCH cytochrome family protein